MIHLSLHEILYLNEKTIQFSQLRKIPSFVSTRKRSRRLLLRSLIFLLPYYFFVATEVGVTAHLAICLFARKSPGLCVHTLALCVIAKGGGEEGREGEPVERER